jgi:hypothetical protein
MHVNHDNGVQHLPQIENYIFEGEKQKKKKTIYKVKGAM